jgi:hypothetical protein
MMMTHAPGRRAAATAGPPIEWAGRRPSQAASRQQGGGRPAWLGTPWLLLACRIRI